MGDWMGSCVDVKLGDGKFNLELLVFLTHVKEGHRITF